MNCAVNLRDGIVMFCLQPVKPAHCSMGFSGTTSCELTPSAIQNSGYLDKALSANCVQ